MPELGFELRAGLQAERLALEAAVAEQADQRDALHVVLLGERGLVVDVDLHDLVGGPAHRRDRLDDRRDLAARLAPRRPEVDDDGNLAAQHLALPLSGRHRRHQLDRVVGHGLVGPLARDDLGRATPARPAGPRARPGAPSGTRGTRSGRRSRAGRGRDRGTAGPGSSGRRCRAGRGRAPARAPSSIGPVIAAGLIASTPAGRTRGRPSGAANRPSARARPPPCENPAKIASERSKPERLALLVDERVELVERGDELAGHVGVARRPCRTTCIRACPGPRSAPAA